MQKPKLPTIELVFVLIAASTIFAVTFNQLSTDGVLPGNDPAVHLLKSKIIIMNQGVSYSAIAWYPPLFHTLLAMLQILAGTQDVMVAAFILKLFISTISVMLLLATYLLARKLFGISIAVSSVVFTLLSVPLVETVFWGGYANFLGFALIAMIFYILIKDYEIKLKMPLLFLTSFALTLSHQLSTFVFVFMFVPVFLVSTIGSRKKFLIFLAMIVGGGLAMLAWYAQIIIDYASVMIEHIFFSGAESAYYISSVNLYALDKNFGISLSLAAIGIPLTLLLIKTKKAPKSSLLVLFWLAIPFLFAQSYLFGINLPYHRFIYFCTTPIAILAAVTVCSITKIPAIVKAKLVPRLPRKHEVMFAVTVICLGVILILFTLQGYLFLVRTGDYPRFYERAPISSYNSGVWVNQHSTENDVMVVPRSPGSWFYVFSDRMTWEETDPLYSRSFIAETVLYSFYEMENSRTLTHEYGLSSPYSGQEFAVSIYKIWRTALSVPNEHVRVSYINSSGIRDPIPLSETVEKIYWLQESNETAQMVSEYTHELFTVYKTVTFSSNSSVIKIDWVVEAHQDLPDVELEVSNVMESSLDYQEAFVPGLLEWQNPWDNATDVNWDYMWTVVQGEASMVDGNVVAVLDATNKILAAFEYGDSIKWVNVGALGNRFIDAVRLRYDLGDLASSESSVASLSVLVYAFEDNSVERLTSVDLMEHYDSKAELPVIQRDYLTYIEEENIKFVIVDTQQNPSGKQAVPDLDVVYNDGRTIVYTTKR